MKNLPFLISIPHGGALIPHELTDSVCISPEDLFDDSDAFTQDIYHPGSLAQCVIKTDIARAFVDVSRAQDRQPPEYPDGVIKSVTCYNRPIYKKGQYPVGTLAKQLLNKYYHTYHQRIVDAMKLYDIVLGLDCHSMAETAPAISPDSGNKRPLINLGDFHGKACDPTITGLLRTAFIKVFNCTEQDVTLNIPFAGGFITRRYGNNRVPWIQIEINRKLYLKELWFDRALLKISKERLSDLNILFKEVLKRFHSNCIENNLL